MAKLQKHDTVHVMQCTDLQSGKTVGKHYGCIEESKGLVGYIVKLFTHRHKGNTPADKCKCHGRLKGLIDENTFITEPKFYASKHNITKIKGYYEE